MQRNRHLDAQFQAVFGVSVDTYWQGPVLGFDIVRFDDDVLRSGDRSAQEALADRMKDAVLRGVPFRVDAAELVLYIRYLATGHFDYRQLDALRARMHQDLRAFPLFFAAGGGPCRTS